MRSSRILLFALLILPTRFVYSAEKLTVLKNITIESCSEGLINCEQVSTETPTNMDIPLAKAGKAKGGRLHGQSKFLTTQADTPFKGEIYVNKLESGFSIYAVLRSGAGTKRPAVTKTIKTGSLSAFDPIELSDKPILIDGKLYRAKMTISPASL